MAPLDDYLGLLARPLADCRLLLFHGASGAGKSSQLRLLATCHPQLQQRQRHWRQPGDPLAACYDVLLIDELRTLADARGLRSALRRSRLLLVASHLPGWQLWPWTLGYRQREFRLDRAGGKLAAHLQRLGGQASPLALQRFQDRFGANYTDLEVLLELGEGSLDRGLQRLRQGARITTAVPPPLG